MQNEMNQNQIEVHVQAEPVAKLYEYDLVKLKIGVDEVKAVNQQCSGYFLSADKRKAYSNSPALYRARVGRHSYAFPCASEHIPTWDEVKPTCDFPRKPEEDYVTRLSAVKIVANTMVYFTPAEYMPGPARRVLIHRIEDVEVLQPTGEMTGPEIGPPPPSSNEDKPHPKGVVPEGVAA